MSKKKKIIVCDFDGCLTCQADGSYFNTDPTKYHASDEILIRLKAFCKKHDVKILMSTNWRKFDSDGYWKNTHGIYNNPLPKLLEDLGDLCIGTLPPERHIRKPECLILWLDDNRGEENYDYVIFDDDVREGFQNTSDYGIKDHFILCDPAVGITDSKLEEALKILN